MPTLAVVGAGPKGIAIAAKARAPGQAARRNLSVSDLLAEYAAEGLRRDGAPGDQARAG